MEKIKFQHILQFRRALQFVWRSAPWWTLASSVITIIQGVMPLVILYLMKLVVDKAAAGIAIADKVEAFRGVMFYIILTGVVFFLNGILGSLAGLIRSYQSLIASDYMLDILHDKATVLELEYYENPQYHDILYRARLEAPFRPNRIVNGLVQVIQNGISLILVAGLLSSLHWGVAVVLFFATMPGVLVRLKFAGMVFRWSRLRTPTDRKANYYSWLLTGIPHAKEIRLFNLGAIFIERFRELRKYLRTERLKLDTKRSVTELATQFGSSAAIFGTYMYIVYRTVNGAITMGDLVMFFMAFQRGLGFLNEILGGLAGLYEDNLFLSNLYEFLNLKPHLFDPPKPKKIPQPIEQGIVFENVSFHYPTGERNVLKNMNITIKKGETVAFVGHNGAGKTTLIKLLCRLYDVTDGAIKIDGIDIRQFSQADLRHQISVIFQDYAQYNLPAKENIWFGNVEQPLAQEDIERAAEQAGVHDLLSRLPKGYDTILGKMFDQGEELSIGEWQKIALARAFLRDSQIIVLDEPTSSMDSASEYEVFNTFRQLMHNRTAIIISHRFSTVRMADCIYVIEKEHIVEHGSHNQLMAQNGKYATMFRQQAENYKDGD